MNNNNSNPTAPTAGVPRSANSSSESMSIEEGLSSLGLLQYIAACREAGVTSWDALSQFSEEDFESLGISLGHRRKLQRAFAQRHDWPNHQPLPTPDDIKGFAGFPFDSESGSSGSDESLTPQPGMTSNQRDDDKRDSTQDRANSQSQRHQRTWATPELQELEISPNAK